MKFEGDLLQLAAKAERDIKQIFQRIEEIQEYNEQKVLEAFIRHRVSESHFMPTTGYGYGDRGREVLDAVFSEIFKTEDALVRHQFASGTHALATALFGILRPKDQMVCITGAPYDTMEEVIGLRGEGQGSLKDFGVCYKQLSLLADKSVDMLRIPDAVKHAKVIYIQRSGGYTQRPAITMEKMKKIIDICKKSAPKAAVVVDNCYGEFTQKQEPSEVGADLIVGSLIKNPGGGIAPSGGYIAGKRDLVMLCANRFTAPGVGKEVGSSLNQNRSLFMGLFFAPGVTAAAMKTSVFALRLFSLLGYKVSPQFDEIKSDIISAICLESEEKLKAFCAGLQAASPIDSFVTPQPWAMPGYDCPVIMADGAFTAGASIEISADAPLQPPYTVWLQGGLTYYTGKMGVLSAAQRLKNSEDKN